MDFRVLGPIEVDVGGSALDLGGPLVRCADRVRVLGPPGGVYVRVCRTSYGNCTAKPFSDI